MAQSKYRTILVAGDNPEEVLKKYSSTTKVERYLKFKRDDAPKLLERHIRSIREILDNDEIVSNISDNVKEYLKELYLSLTDTDEFDYYLDITKGCYYDEETGDAYSTENPNAKYAFYKLGNIHLGEPFILNNGDESFIAKIKDINWDELHMNKTKAALCKRVWQLIVEEDAPNDENEEKMVNNWNERKQYFLNFNTCDEYIKHTCSFWHYAFATDDKYEQIDYTISDKDWVANYYDKFIKNLNPETQLTICEVRMLD